MLRACGRNVPTSIQSPYYTLRGLDGKEYAVVYILCNREAPGDKRRGGASRSSAPNLKIGTHDKIQLLIANPDGAEILDLPRKETDLLELRLDRCYDTNLDDAKREWMRGAVEKGTAFLDQGALKCELHISANCSSSHGA